MGFLLIRMRVDVPKIVPPFMRRKACFILQGAGLILSVAVGNPKGLWRLRVDVPKIVPPFILRCRYRSNWREDVYIRG